MSEPLLDVYNLRTQFTTDDGVIRAVDDVSFSVDAGKTLGIVGESGCGKTVTALSILQLVPPPGSIVGGRVLYRHNGRQTDLARLHPRGRQMRQLRGNEIAMVYQEPMTALCPVYTIGNQIMESVMLHQRVSRHQAREQAVEMLTRVGIASPAQRVDEYPHELSGGMRQRAMIAMALCCSPNLLIADEPTTAVDVTTQAQILSLLRQLQVDLAMTAIIITHNLGVVAELCDAVLVMYLGRLVEYGSVPVVFHGQKHPYTRGLFDSIPLIDPHGTQRLTPIRGAIPGLGEIPPGCTFAPRCESATERCLEQPPVIESESRHRVACWLYR